jgi:hypothetical protein
MDLMQQEQERQCGIGRFAELADSTQDQLPSPLVKHGRRKRVLETRGGCIDRRGEAARKMGSLRRTCHPNRSNLANNETGRSLKTRCAKIWGQLASASGKRITPAVPQNSGRLQVAMFAAQQRLEKKVQLVSCHPDFG